MMRKSFCFMVLLSALTCLCFDVPTDVSWLMEYAPAKDGMPAADVWNSGYAPELAVVRDGALFLDHSTAQQPFQTMSLSKWLEALERPVGDPLVSIRVRCLEVPADNASSDFEGVLMLSCAYEADGSSHGVVALLSLQEALTNFSTRRRYKAALTVGEVAEFTLLLRRATGVAHLWLNGQYVGRESLSRTSAGKAKVTFGDGSGGVAGKLAVEEFRLGLADCTGEYVSSSRPYVEPSFVSGIIHNEDCTNYLMSDYPTTKDGIENFMADRYLSSHCQIKEMMLNTQGQRAAYDSDVIEASWDGVEVVQEGVNGKMTFRGKDVTPDAVRIFSRAIELNSKGIDYYSIWIDFLRGKGISPWISLRMNDVHEANNEDSWVHCELWREHPEYRIAPYRRGDWFAQQLDYAVPEVRERMLKVVDEQLERYDCDGIELDWMRFCRVFKYGQEARNRHILTDFVQAVRDKIDRAAERRGHPIKLAVRVQMDPADAFNLGFDVLEWSRRKLIDMLIAAPFFTNNWDQCPVEVWRAIVGPDVTLAVGIDTCFEPYPTDERPCGPDFDNALATYYLAHGADRIYLFNHFGDARDTMSTLGALETASAGARRHVPLYKDDVPPGGRKTYVLPITLQPTHGAWFALSRISLGVAPEAGRKAVLMMAARNPSPDGILPIVRLNGELVEPCNVPELPVFSNSYKALYAWAIPDGLLEADGNLIDVCNNFSTPFQIDWVEIYVPAK